MKIETKHNIGDEVWVYTDQPTQVVIERIYIKVRNNGVKISCDFKVTEEQSWRLPESCLFPTKEELLKSLRNEMD